MNIEQRISNYEVFLSSFYFTVFTLVTKTAKSTKRISISNILLSFYIHYSLFDIKLMADSSLQLEPHVLYCSCLPVG